MESAFKGIAFVILQMQDFDQTVAFYTRLGLQQNYSDEQKREVNFSFASAGDGNDARPEIYTDILCSSVRDTPPPGETGIRIKLREDKDIWQWVKQTKAQGVEFLTPDVVETDWVYEIKVKDPAGNILTIFK